MTANTENLECSLEFERAMSCDAARRERRLYVKIEFAPKVATTGLGDTGGHYFYLYFLDDIASLQLPSRLNYSVPTRKEIRGEKTLYLVRLPSAFPLWYLRV